MFVSRQHQSLSRCASARDLHQFEDSNEEAVILSAAVHFFHQIKDEIRSCRFDPRDGFSHVKSGRYSDYAVPQHAKRMTDRELSFPWLFWPFHEIWIVRDKQAFIN